MVESILKPRRAGKVILLIILNVLILLGMFIAGFVGGAIFMRWQDEFTDWDLMDNSETSHEPGTYDTDCPDCAYALKPVIYLYPTKVLSATVRLDYDGQIITDIPTYNQALCSPQHNSVQA